MSERDELLGKADALLRRYRGGVVADFPVLTEVIDQPHLNEPVPAISGTEIDHAQSRDATEPNLRHLEDRLFQQVLSAVESRIADLAHEFVREHFHARMNSVLDSVGDEIAAEIRTKLSVIVRETVSAAIDRELAAHPLISRSHKTPEPE